MGNADSTDGRDTLPEATRRLASAFAILATELDAGTIGGARCEDVTVRYRDERGEHSVIVRLFNGDVTMHGGEEPTDRERWWAIVDAAELAAEGGGGENEVSTATVRIAHVTMQDLADDWFRSLAQAVGQ